ncbi:MAG: hypothetical protein ACKPKO_44635 [Candidatus Fonsibacter sp.]
MYIYNKRNAFDKSHVSVRSNQANKLELILHAHALTLYRRSARENNSLAIHINNILVV